ncbi:MAG: class I SAM-dependent methyltransferase [Desertifilum sp. SIO1I2]|nr:class I SAM-dependent methyltransferase [Desertifilum sp. SIO1I2]
MKIDDRPVTRLEPSSGLRRENFTRISKNGFGDRYNGISHSMSYFQGKVYVGTSRCNLQMIAVNNPPSTAVWPVKCPENVYQLDRRAQIWCYDPTNPAGGWTNAYTAPWVTGSDGTEVPQDMGYRGQAIFQGTSDSAPTLYVCTWSPSKGPAPQLLRSQEGLHFERVGSLGSGDRSFNTFRTLYPFKGRLFTAPTGRTKGYGQADDCMAEATVYVTCDPLTQPWQAASPPSFNDPTNLTAFEMVEFNNHLYVGTVNATSGYQIWKTKAEGDPPYQWTQVLANGAYRGNLNEMPVSMTVFNNALYIGSGIQNGGYDKVYHIGPAGAELIRIYPDDTWDLIVGEARLTPHGYKYPLSDIGPGFDSLFNAHFWRSVVYEGWLYVSTYNWSIFLPYLSQQNWSNTFKKRIQKLGIHNIVQKWGGCDLWRTQDGVRWLPVSRNGLDNPYNYGIRTMVPTPHGLFLGTANTFGPEVCLRVSSGEWTYAPNPSSGTEVWLGVPPQQTPVVVKTEEPSQTVAELKEKYDVRMYEPLVDEYYDYSDFYSWGYWDAQTQTQKEACLNMMELLISLIPEKRGNIIDVACGKGATSRCLLKYYPPSAITGIDISDKLMDTCRQNAPGCEFVVMDATRMDFADASCDNMICVDGAGLFDTRERFLHEAFRVLKPGGRLILSDRLISKAAVKRLRSINWENYVRDLKEYDTLYQRAGFDNVQIYDVTPECLGGYTDRFSDFICRKFTTQAIDRDTFNNFMSFILSRTIIIRYYVFVSAQKPV